MPEYTYLDTNTPFEANELNLRFDSLMGTTKGLNALSVEDFALGALRHNHLPVMIHDSTLSDSELLPSEPVTGTGPFSSHRSIAFSTPTKLAATSGVNITAVTFPNAITLEYADAETPSAQNVTSVIVLANVDIVRFEALTTSELLEDKVFVSAAIRVTDSTGDSDMLLPSSRVLSPRLTIGYNAGGQALISETSPLARDSQTNQDISIRTVITSSDLSALNLIDIDTVSLTLTANTSEVYYGKANLTAIPLQAKLT